MVIFSDHDDDQIAQLHRLVVPSKRQASHLPDMDDASL
jgi:hypothetical protein